MGRRLSSDYRRWFEDVYPELTGCGTWLRGCELNTLPATEYAARPFHALFVRLSTYSDVATSFSHLSVYQTASGMPDIFPDLAYLPPEHDAKIFERDRIPWLIGTATKRGPGGFHLIGFSNAIIQELINIPHFLKTSGIPLKRSERLDRPDVPLIILGGANAPFTSAIWGTGSLVDGIFVGQDSDRIRKILGACAEGTKKEKSKHELLKELADIPGFYPTDTVRNNAGADAACSGGRIELLENGIVPFAEESAGSGYLQISEGCRANCSFCAENWTRKPYREVDPAVLVKGALAMKAAMACEKINLFSFNFNMHSCFYSLLWDLVPLFAAVGLKSQRLDMLAEHPAMIECQTACGKTTFSAGIEGISPRLRRYLNKNLGEEALRKSLDLIFKAKARELKIFLLSTGMEEEEDFAAFDSLLSFIRTAKAGHDAGTRVIISITPLVRFPWTPLEFDAASPKEVHDTVIAGIKRHAAAHGFEAREAMDTKEYLISQILARASEPAILGALLGAIQDTGFVYYRYIPQEFAASFHNHLRKAGLSTERLLQGSSYDEGLAKPWAAIATGIERKLLGHIYTKNRAFTEIGTGLDAIKMEPPSHSPAEYKERTRTAKSDEIPAGMRVHVAERGRGLPRRYIGIALSRALMKSDNALIPHFRSYVSSYWDGGDERPCWITGDDIITLAWNSAALPLLGKRLAEAKFLKAVDAHLGGWASLRGRAGAEEPPYRLHITSPYRFDGTGYFKGRGLKYTLVKDKTKETSFLQFTKDSLKKNIIGECSYKITDTVSVDLVPGKKFVTGDFVREAFSCPKKNDWVRIMVTAHAEEGIIKTSKSGSPS